MAGRLIIIRGNSGSGKSTVARMLQQRLGYNTALIEQDYIRRKLLRVQDTQGNPAIGLIDLTARYALEQGYDVIIEGILPVDRYSSMLLGLAADYRHFVYYFDLPFDETLRRHQMKPNAYEFGESEMREWWREKDYLGCSGEYTIERSMDSEMITQQIIDDIQVV